MSDNKVPLDPTAPQPVSYCIPEWLKMEQVKLACARPIPRLQGDPEKAPKREEPIAIVCFGPSLQDTWEEIRAFKHVMTCSGAHKFLLERGIVPEWHVEVDPRAHKVELLGPPHPDVTYLPASTCHPAYFDHIAGHKIQLWHVFDSAEEGLRTLPRGEWAITGGPNVGLRAMTLARFFGFTEMHVFGMDGCARESGHAAAHPNGPKDKHLSPCEYGGKTYMTTPAMLESARQTWHELDMMHDVRATFHGEGLVQAMAREYKSKKKSTAPIAFSKPELISASYRDLNSQLHRDNLAYGVGGGKHAPTVIKLVEKTGCKSVLDYGCGKGYLAKALPFPIWEYDPAIPEKAESPRPADLVCCMDVLEHVEPDRILFVLDDLRRVTQKVGYFIIHTGPSAKTLADGRNAHILQRDRAWWSRMLGKFFVLGQITQTGPLLHVVVAPKAKKQVAAA